MKQEEREEFFSQDDTGIIRALTGRSVHQGNAATQVTQGDFEATTGWTRHRPKGMTAQYLNECVDKRNGMEVTDQYGTIRGWVYDCHKNIGKWVPGDIHDDRVKLMSTGFGVEELKPIYEPYHYTPGEGSIHTPASFTEGMEAHISDPVNPNHYQGFSNGAEVIDITENLTFNAGNAVKYLSRAGRIDGQNKGAVLEDLRKAAWYVAREIDRIEVQE